MTTKLNYLEISNERLDIAHRTIFRPLEKESKFKVWLRRVLLEYVKNSSPAMKRYRRIHHWGKRMVFQRGLKLLKRVLGKYMIKGEEDIEKYWFNNHLRIFHHSFIYGLKDAFKFHFFGMKSPEYKARYNNDPEQFFYEFAIKPNYWSWDNRSSIINLWITEILEDTFDREWINMAMMRICHEMMCLYGVSPEEMAKVPKPGQYPIYMSPNEFNPQYQLLADHPVIGKIWESKEVLHYGKKSESEESNKGEERGKESEGNNGKESGSCNCDCKGLHAGDKGKASGNDTKPGKLPRGSPKKTNKTGKTGRTKKETR